MAEVSGNFAIMLSDIKTRQLKLILVYNYCLCELCDNKAAIGTMDPN